MFYRGCALNTVQMAQPHFVQVYNYLILAIFVLKNSESVLKLSIYCLIIESYKQYCSYNGYMKAKYERMDNYYVITGSSSGLFGQR